jgi:hypothetical protein
MTGVLNRRSYFAGCPAPSVTAKNDTVRLVGVGEPTDTMGVPGTAGGRGVNVNVATQFKGVEGIRKVAAHGAGLHPAKVDPPDGVAVRVTVAPGRYDPPPLTVPDPVPAVLTVRATG